MKDYKEYHKCKKCKRTYGSDLKKDDGLCPLCTPGRYNLRRYKNAKI